MAIVEREAWLTGPVEGVPGLLQPVAHALLQARTEVIRLMNKFNEKLLWEKPAGLASPAFHLHHLSGVISRLFTYCQGQPLSGEQLTLLSAEGKENHPDNTLFKMLDRFDKQVDQAIAQLTHTNSDTLLEPRGVGRAQIPSTVIGLLVHAAEHTTRHTGQLLVTVHVLKA